MKILLFFSCLFIGLSSKAQVNKLTSTKYVKATAFRHSNLKKLTFSKDNSFRIKQKNFKGTQIFEGKWSVSSDTIKLTYLNKETKEIVKSEILLVKEDGLYDPKINYREFQTKKAWRAGGKIYEGGISF